MPPAASDNRMIATPATIGPGEADPEPAGLRKGKSHAIG